MPPAELFAIGSAATLAASAIILRFALRKQPSQYNAVFAFLSGTVLLWAFVLALGTSIPTGTALALFAVRGLLDPGIAAFLIFSAFRTIGVALTVPIIAASPLVSTALSMFWFNEQLTLPKALGTTLIIAGVVFLALKKPDKKIGIKPILIAITGSVLIGVAAVLTKAAMNASNQPTPESGLAISFTAAVAVQALAIIALRKQKELAAGWEGIKLFALAGAFVAAGFLLVYFAFLHGEVSIIYPLSVSTQPLFALILSFILLRQQEKITKNIVLGTLAIVAGAVLLSVV
ncbi:DMT family transporter [Candidatus Woesearchaeota archaeon]|nr:DMT family transporter [Candidatus Woesearchaeota archaeon]